MGSTLHNKIHLGRTSVLASKRVRAALALSALASFGLIWMVLRSFD